MTIDNDTTILEENLRPFNLAVIPITGDGNCFFRAFSHQVFGTEDYHLYVRDICMDHIEKERDYYSNFIEGETFEHYIERKRKPGTWADNIEIYALSEIYNARIEIYVTNEIPIIIFSQNAEPDKIVRVFYKNKNHYDSIVELSDDKTIYTKLDDYIEEQRSQMENRNQIIGRGNLGITKGFTVDQVINKSMKSLGRDEERQIAKLSKESEKQNIEDDIARIVMEESKQNAKSTITLMDRLTNLGFPVEIALQAVMVFGNDEEDTEKVLNHIYNTLLA